jgi:hypothetical protein
VSVPLTPTAPAQNAGQFASFTAVAATTAAVAAFASVTLALPIWAMFLGWVAWFTRGVSVRDGLANLACLLLGIALGVGAALAVGALLPAFGALTFPAVVFVVACIVVSLRAVPVVNNVLCYFLGLIGLFAAHVPPTPSAFARLAAAGTLGAAAAAACRAVQKRLAQPAPTTSPVGETWRETT